MNTDHGVKDKDRVSGTLPGTAGDYMEQRITFGASMAGSGEKSFMGVTALLEDCPAGAILELWLPKVGDGATLASGRTDADYFFSGRAVYPARTAVTPTGITGSYGYETWSLAGYPGAQLRLRSGGNGGAAAFSGTAF
jgi:hypothetical protein